jgi:hypothetical protein
MTLRGSVFTANAGLPEADAVQVFVQMCIHVLSFKECQKKILYVTQTHIRVYLINLHIEGYVSPHGYCKANPQGNHDLAAR